MYTSGHGLLQSNPAHYSAPFATVSEEYSDEPGQSDATRVHECPPVALRKMERFARGKSRP